MRPTVLLFQTNPQKTLSVRILAQKLGLRVLVAAPAQLDLPLADILEQTPGEGSGEPLPGEMLVRAGLNGKITRTCFCRAAPRARGRRAQGGSHADKQRLDARALYAELQREHEAMAAGKTAHPAELKEEKKTMAKEYFRTLSAVFPIILRREGGRTQILLHLRQNHGLYGRLLGRCRQRPRRRWGDGVAGTLP